MRRAAAFLLALTACTPPPPPETPSANAVAALAARTQLVGTVVRAATACGWPLTRSAQDQAAQLETAVIALHQRAGGIAARDAFLVSMRPIETPAAGARADWCARQRPDLAGVERFLTGAEGTALLEQAEATLALAEGRN